MTLIMHDNQAAAQEKDRKRRGTYPPSLRLSDAVELAKKISDQAGGSTSYDLFSTLTGNTKTSSTFIKKVAALRQYGIIEDSDGLISLSEIGRRITHPINETDDALAVKEAMLKIDTLNRVYERHRGRLLPDEQFLVNILVQELKVDPEVAPQWAEWFRDGCRTARILFVRPDGKTQVLDTVASGSNGVSDKPSLEKEVEIRNASPSSAVVPSPQWEFSNTELPIPLGPGRLAKIQLPKDWNAQKDLNRLLKMLRLSLADDDFEEAEK